MNDVEEEISHLCFSLEEIKSTLKEFLKIFNG